MGCLPVDGLSLPTKSESNGPRGAINPVLDAVPAAPGRDRERAAPRTAPTKFATVFPPALVLDCDGRADHAGRAQGGAPAEWQADPRGVLLRPRLPVLVSRGGAD